MTTDHVTRLLPFFVVFGCTALDFFVKLSLYIITHFHIKRNRVVLFHGGARLHPVKNLKSNFVDARGQKDKGQSYAG